MAKYIDTKEAAAITGWTMSGVNHFCRSGKIDCHKDDLGRWKISKSSLESFLVNRKPNKHTNKENLAERIEKDKRDKIVRISPGNTKLGKIPSFNLLPLKTCAGSTALCRKYCYARQSLQYSCQANKAWTVNTYMVNKHLDAVEHTISHWLTKRKPVLFRIHAAGDFVSQEYLDMWQRIAGKFTETRFLAFTKHFTLDYTEKPDNLVVMYSVFPDSDYDSIPADGNKLSFAVFPADMPDKHYDPTVDKQITDQRLTLPCPGDCRGCGVCWHIDRLDVNVMFKIHGSIRRK